MVAPRGYKATIVRECILKEAIPEHGKTFNEPHLLLLLAGMLGHGLLQQEVGVLVRNAHLLGVHQEVLLGQYAFALLLLKLVLLRGESSENEHEQLHTR